MSSLALCVVALIKKTQVAVYVGFCVFIVGWIMQIVVIFGVPYTPDYWKLGGTSWLIEFMATASLIP